MSYYQHDQEEFDRVKEQIDELAEIGHTLPSWPMKFVQDMRNRLAKHGREITLSVNQVAKLDEIFKQYIGVEKEEKVKDTTYGFEELANRDKRRRF